MNGTVLDARTPAKAPGLALRTPGAARTVNAWYLATFCGALVCIALMTVYGLMLVGLHADMIRAESVLLGRFGMTVLVAPDDPHLISFTHRLSSALFFGLTLGVLNAMVCMVVTFPAWLSGRLTRTDAATAVCAGLACAYLIFSRELPVISVAMGLFCPFFFTAAWAFVLRMFRGAPVDRKRFALICAIIVSPVILTVAMGSSFLNVRDAMIAWPVLSGISDFYYDHTLLSADVIKTPAMRSQNVVAVEQEERSIGHSPHGTLWIRAKEPCSVDGARFAVASNRLACPSVVVPRDGLPVNSGNRVFEAAQDSVDPNHLMRSGLGVFFRLGPMVFMTMLLLSWLALGLHRLSRRSLIAAVAVIAAYLGLFMPLFTGSYLSLQLRSDAAKIAAYAVSAVEQKRYIAVSAYPGAIDDEALAGMLRDSSVRVRVNALVEAGERRNPIYLPLIEKCLQDPQLNVRTKACWSLGRIATDRSLELLLQAARTDPSWYVRDYAYAASGRMRPEIRVAGMDE